MTEKKLQVTGNNTLYATLPGWVKDLWKWKPKMPIDLTFDQREESITIKEHKPKTET